MADPRSDFPIEVTLNLYDQLNARISELAQEVTLLRLALEKDGTKAPPLIKEVEPPADVRKKNKSLTTFVEWICGHATDDELSALQEVLRELVYMRQVHPELQNAFGRVMDIKGLIPKSYRGVHTLTSSSFVYMTKPQFERNGGSADAALDALFIYAGKPRPKQ